MSLCCQIIMSPERNYEMVELKKEERAGPAHSPSRLGYGTGSKHFIYL